MDSNVIFFAWNRSVPGREAISAEHFQEFVQYLGTLQSQDKITSFTPVLLDLHGGDVNGFFLIQGESSALKELVSSETWIKHTTRASIHLEGSGTVRGVTGDLIKNRMDLWKSQLPKS